MVTVTSSKGTVIGASGLWTLTSTSSTPSCFRQAWAMRSASVSMRLTGSPCDDGHDLLRHDAVVHGLRQVVVGGGRPGVQAQDEVHDEGLALLALLGEHTVVPAGLQAAQRDTIHANHSCNRRSRPVRTVCGRHPGLGFESTCEHDRAGPRGRGRAGPGGSPCVPLGNPAAHGLVAAHTRGFVIPTTLSGPAGSGRGRRPRPRPRRSRPAPASRGATTASSRRGCGGTRWWRPPAGRRAGRAPRRPRGRAAAEDVLGAGHQGGVAVTETSRR